MADGFEVLSPGLHTTLQDLGRFGFQDQGVPVAGALDPVGLRLANAMVGNPTGTAGLEISYMGPSLRVTAPSARVAVCGDVRLTLTQAGTSRPLDANRSWRLRQGDVLAIGAVTGASTAYLAVEGGFALDPVLGSLSTYVRAGLGPLGGRPVQAGTRLPLWRDQCGDGDDLGLAAPFDYGDGPIRVVLGPQDGAFTAQALATLSTAEYRVGKDADRMGLRLDGPTLAHRAGADIPSDGLVSGCIQVPGNGAPIILLADHQTAGGYAKIATVISADLPRLGRMMPGTALRFAVVDVARAEQARRDLEQRIKRSIAALTAIAAHGVDLQALYETDLICGVVDAVSGWGR